MATEQELSEFLKSVEKRAFKRSVYHVRNEESALDIVQESMMKLAEHYGDKPAAELPMLFQRILSNCTLDWFRRNKTRNALFSNMGDFEALQDDGDFDLLETLTDDTSTPQTESAQHAAQRAQLLQGDRKGDTTITAASTGSVHDALLGGDGRDGNSPGHGLLGRQRQDALLACSPCTEYRVARKGNKHMTISRQYQTEILQERFALKIAARLSDGCDELPRDISERLRFARTQAVAKRKIVANHNVALALGGGPAATLGTREQHVSWWNRIGVVLPLLALVLGLIAIHSTQNDRIAQEMAQLDAALLTDDLPLAAYADPGFSQFLKVSRAQSQ